MFTRLESDRLARDAVDSRRIILNVNYEEVKQDFLENPNEGGPLFGKIYGNNHNSIADLLSLSTDLRKKDEKEIISGVSCFIVTGTSKYGKITVWFAPEKNFTPMKWIIEKDPTNYYDEAEISSKWPDTKNARYEFGVKEFHEITEKDNTVYIPKLSHYKFVSNSKSGTKTIYDFEYKTSDIQLNPDFEALEAFNIDFEDGIRVFNRDFTSAKFVWEKGKPVPYIDKSVLDAIDIQIEQMANTKETKSLKETNNIKNIHESMSVYDMQSQIQTNNIDSEPEEQSKNNQLYALVLIGLLIICLIVFYLFHRLKA